MMGKVPFHSHSDLFPAVDFPTVILPTTRGEGQRLESAEICSTRKYAVQDHSKPATALAPVKPHLLPQTNSTLSPAFLLQHTEFWRLSPNPTEHERRYLHTSLILSRNCWDDGL